MKKGLLILALLLTTASFAEETPTKDCPYAPTMEHLKTCTLSHQKSVKGFWDAIVDIWDAWQMGN